MKLSFKLAVAGAKRKMEQTADQLRAAAEAEDKEEADAAEEARVVLA